MKDVKTVDMNHLTPEQILEEIVVGIARDGGHKVWDGNISPEKLAAYLAEQHARLEQLIDECNRLAQHLTK